MVSVRSLVYEYRHDRAYASLRKLTNRRSAFLVQVHLPIYTISEAANVKICVTPFVINLDSRTGVFRYLGRDEGLNRAAQRCREAIDV